MPAATAVASIALAVLLAACGGDDVPAGPVQVLATDMLEFEPDELRTGSGAVTIELTSGADAEHTFVVEELGDLEVVAAAGGETATGSVELEAGVYTFYCDVPGHREAGMEGTLTVEE